MFQYAAARALADRLCMPLKLDISDFESYTLRKYEINAFRIRAEIARDADIAKFRVVKNRFTFWQRLLRKTGMQNNSLVFSERSYSYDDRIEALRSPVYLDGYWQSERYFAGYIDALRSDFILAEDIDQANKEMRNRIDSVCAVSIHIRRGDYVTNDQTNKYHGTCSVEYYNGAILYIKDHVRDPHFFAFSDDHEWTRENITTGDNVTYVDINSSERGVLDMELMRSCRHHIIANSSFSWWGAWLNPSPDKIVVAPGRWFKQTDHDTKDLFPSGWVRL